MYCFQPITIDELKDIIASTKIKYSTVDDIPVSLLKTVISTSVSEILMTVNQSLYTGIFPSCLKQSHITPIIKDAKGDPDSLSNYRPVIDLSFLSKILEKTVLRQLIPHLETNSLLHPHQSAYNKKS